jgi:hypothetical protein
LNQLYYLNKILSSLFIYCLKDFINFEKEKKKSKHLKILNKMWPMLLDMPRNECKKTLRVLELEAYASVVTTFRAQGDLNLKKNQVLKDLQSLLKVSVDRHKAEMRRALNDEKLYTIAKRLSHGESLTTQWEVESKRLIPLLPRLQQQNNTNTYYRIVADHILKKAEPCLNLYPQPVDTQCEYNNNNNSDLDENQYNYDIVKKVDNKMINNDGINNDHLSNNEKRLTTKRKKKSFRNFLDSTTNDNNGDNSNQVKIADTNQNMVYLANGYSVDSNSVQSKFYFYLYFWFLKPKLIEIF